MKRVIVALGLLIAIATAHAENKTKAREAFRRATQHYFLAEYAEALESFKEAYRNYEDPVFLYNIAQCHRQLGAKQDALAEYRMYLVRWPQAANRDAVLDVIAKLERAIADDQAAAATPVPAPGVVAPTPPPPVAATVVGAPAAAAPARPLYKKWWLWTTVGAVVAVGVGVGVGVGVTRAHATPSAMTGLGTFKF